MLSVKKQTMIYFLIFMLQQKLLKPYTVVTKYKPCHKCSSIITLSIQLSKQLLLSSFITIFFNSEILEIILNPFLYINIIFTYSRDRIRKLVKVALIC